MSANHKNEEAATGIAAGQVSTGTESSITPPPPFIPSRQRERRVLLALYRESTGRGLIPRVYEICQAKYRGEHFTSGMVSEVFNYYSLDPRIRGVLLEEIAKALPGLTHADLNKPRGLRRRRKHLQGQTT